MIVNQFGQLVDQREHQLLNDVRRRQLLPDRLCAAAPSGLMRFRQNHDLLGSGNDNRLRPKSLFRSERVTHFTYAAAACGNSVSGSVNYSMNVGFRTFVIPISATACFP